MGRTFLRSPLLDRKFVASNIRIFDQDHAVLKNVRPERVPDSWQQEVSLKSDAFRYRLERACWNLGIEAGVLTNSVLLKNLQDAKPALYRVRDAEPLPLRRSNQSRCIIKIELSTIATSMLTDSTIVLVVESRA